MPPVQRVIGVRVAGCVARRPVAFSQMRFSSNTPPTQGSDEAPGPKAGESSLARTESASEGMAKHQPNYHAALDFRTSTFSPVPKHVMDGSESDVSVPAAVTSGAPIDLQARTVRIYQQAKNAMQSGAWHGNHWLMDWDVLSKGHRWENPLIGWQSTADVMQGERMEFKSKEDAINFANKQGYEYFVQEPNERRFIPKAYANNFMYSPKKLKIVRTK
ncbi:putative NADH-ubiquinone oxidoreductase 21 kDa subunit mitochondrial precursor [Trichodelitschia bisporula]|uniref:NADH dehydrogenase [ubiquinone] iron-sulfur protein 4, mitochondrial n=1 Tax=Trichodelitschia bisporula TaxID=703511 RepID=A0A6G1HLN5_9PEZI|nr:putative NADH-ubiquinone oxidoreductase 21 kDa subunit mitochondrial precursor [Trichodelitschia bisporula]